MILKINRLYQLTSSNREKAWFFITDIKDREAHCIQILNFASGSIFIWFKDRIYTFGDLAESLKISYNYKMIIKLMFETDKRIFIKDE